MLLVIARSNSFLYMKKSDPDQEIVVVTYGLFGMYGVLTPLRGQVASLGPHILEEFWYK
jgi:hypothetical protein